MPGGYKADKSIVVLKETHSIEGDEELWRKEWGADIIFAHGSNNSKGVTILLPLQIQNIEVIKKWNDTDGRMGLLKFKIGDEYI